MEARDPNSNTPGDVPAQGAEFLEYAAGVFHEISLLEIRKSYRLLTELSPELIEGFVQKYSDFIIFLLNILDQQRSMALLARLTDSALIYIVEEELRTLLIRGVGDIARVGGDFMNFSLFLELCDRPLPPEFKPGGGSVEIPEYVPLVLREQGIGLREARAGRSFFAALDALNDARRLEVLELIFQRNMFVSVGLLIYASNSVAFATMDFFARSRPELLGALPEAWLSRRLESSGQHELYTADSAAAFLPAALRGRLEKLRAFRERHKGAFARIAHLKATELEAARRRQAIVDLVFALVQSADADQVGMLLHGFVQDGSLSAADRDLIRTVAAR